MCPCLFSSVVVAKRVIVSPPLAIKQHQGIGRWLSSIRLLGSAAPPLASTPALKGGYYRMLCLSRRMERTCLMSTAPTKGTIVVRTRALRNVPQCPGIPTKMLAFILRTASRGGTTYPGARQANEEAGRDEGNSRISSFVPQFSLSSPPSPGLPLRRTLASPGHSLDSVPSHSFRNSRITCLSLVPYSSI
ncbi:hypothetical protein CTAM01_04481 [Colletotrichum tamarilloi]|uniref:Uncharacterized protein n=1 Tax=Colletotrichum tamarilloi TaxID=1209934 RepID=A0ABQ9RIC4_9PEZI|nr:uncharacterized protein CTAM01_04481 [Colletotrichum tamarilloi]KAK1504251.1 hypothetical protein CTAM01_04481 [Colletotrichum tamarilloi]